MSEIKLLPCPFCNSEVKMMDIGEGEHDHYYMIQCQNPNCDGATCYGENSKEEVAKRWNTRKPMERILTRLEEEKIEMYKEWLKSSHLQDKGEYLAYKHATEICKEEGGIE